jgi:hypothetical protein
MLKEVGSYLYLSLIAALSGDVSFMLATDDVKIFEIILFSSLTWHFLLKTSQISSLLVHCSLPKRFIRHH